jgi:HlyD family secretion protein
MGMDRKIEKKKISKGKLAAIALACVVALVIVFNLFVIDTRSSENVNRDQVFIHEVTEDTFLEFIEVSGVVQPLYSTMLDAVEGGVVQQIFVESGEMVEAGDTLFTLSNSGLQLSVLQQEAGLYDQINNVRNSRLNLEQNHLRLREELANAETQKALLEPPL